MNIVRSFIAWLIKRKTRVLRTAGWAIVIGNIYLAWMLPFLPFKMDCHDGEVITFYTNFHYRYLTIYAEGPNSAGYSNTVLFHSAPNRFSSTVKPDLEPGAAENTPRLEMTILTSLAMWFDIDYFANASDPLASPIIEEDSGKTWREFEDEIMDQNPNYSFKTACAAYHIVATEGRVPSMEDILIERDKLYSYIKTLPVY